jgi:hypothetical protein
MVAMLVARPAHRAPTPPAGPFAVGVPAPAAPTASSGAPKTVDLSRPQATYEHGVHETQLGKLRLVDVIPGKAGLRHALEGQQKSAQTARERLLLFVVTTNCLPCNGVALALRDSRMQSALGGVRLVRVDVSDFRVELAALGIPTDSVPGFALLSTEGLRPMDFVHGGEWDADVPENIAPVLGAFVRGKYTERRHRFRGAQRADETTL